MVKDMFAPPPTPGAVAFYNPLGVSPRDFITIDSPLPALADVMDVTLSVDEINEYTRTLDGKQFVFSDYTCRKGDVWATVRVYPKDKPEEYDRDRLDMVVLRPDYEQPYDETLHKTVLPTGTLELREGDTITATYKRLNGVKAPYEAVVLVWNAERRSVDRLSYWDYGRSLPDGTTEFYFVEMNAATGMFQMYRGYPVPSKSVSAVPRNVDAG